MTRLFHAAALLTAALAPVAASAATYSAKPAAPVAARHIVARDIAWSCGPEACRGSTELSRPLVLCQGLARKAGRIESFLVDGRPLAAADLDKCNQNVRGGGTAAVAAAN